MVDSSTFGFNKYNFEIKSGFKGVRQKFLKNCYLPSYAIIFGQRTFVSFIKLDFWEKREFYLFYYSAFLKDHVLFK